MSAAIAKTLDERMDAYTYQDFIRVGRNGQQGEFINSRFFPTAPQSRRANKKANRAKRTSPAPF